MDSGRGKVVIVEDDAQMASLYEVWLEEEYSVQIAPDSETAYELIDETVDVLLLDGISRMEAVMRCWRTSVNPSITVG